MVSRNVGPVLMKQDVVNFLTERNVRQQAHFLIFTFIATAYKVSGAAIDRDPLVWETRFSDSWPVLI